ncbi:pyruvate carboxylase [Limnohabitans sp. MMS-10A-160]|uniref:pyruvate carboxylase n=1 Tax=Limnohabitans sp. MMS-10A-160 TaxID=1835766 RepID=UPI000D391736|nr:pyruvate carboxylase [Limnohabitans sp. MMS-10A-160]PUE22961.1 pyruvate carboxylase [Limnohabitans sp. MMS-10A-160]
MKSILIANRGEIAIRVMRAATEMGMRTVAVYSIEDRFSLHRFKADESYLIGAGQKPIAAYLSIDEIIRVAKLAKVDAIHPGYGFLSENPEFADACETVGIKFIGPKGEVMRTLGNKVAARNLAESVGVPVMPATPPLPTDEKECIRLASLIGYPVMLKASWGGGGRGMRIIANDQELATQMPVARSEAMAAFGDDEIYLEKLVQRARHVEVQVLADTHGHTLHLFERDCSVQRRNQKVVERAPAPYLNDSTRHALCGSALKLARAVNYTHAGTVEFLMDADSGEFYFIEVNPRIQVEHTVTEQITGVDLIKAQIAITQGAEIGVHGAAVPPQEELKINGYALQCRVTTEDPEKNFTPDYGRLSTYRSTGGFGVRLDSGTAYSGAVITPYYDSLLVKVTSWGVTSDDAISRMDRSLREFRIRGVATNLAFLENVIAHPLFKNGQCTTRFIDQTPDLLKFTPRRDRATKLLKYLGDISINGHPEMKGRTIPALPLAHPIKPKTDLSQPAPQGTRDLLKSLGAKGFADWVKDQPQVLLTDTTMRDAHQSLLATRMRTYDMVGIAPYYSRLLPNLFSLECWGGATFDVSMRFLNEDPWERLSLLRQAVPNVLLQMLLRASNAVGYTNYPDNVVKFFVQQAAQAGIDVFRVFDSLNSVENMRIAMDSVNETGAICEAAICYTGDVFDSKRDKFNLAYYVKMAKELESAGAHILAIKDMAGVCRPSAASALVKALKNEVGLPIHFHTHDTSGLSGASVLAAIEAGCDVVDGALDSMSGLTSQPNLGSLVSALEGTARDPKVNQSAMRSISNYWEGVRRIYSPFESEIRCGTSDVYRHEMPGGQYTNLREQARSMGIEHRWPDIAEAYAEVNLMFGDIVKVTPTSKVVGDMALFMVASDLTQEDVTNPEKEIAFPESVVQLMRGELGFPEDGFPAALQKKILKGQAPMSGRPGENLAPVDLEQEREKLKKYVGHDVDDQQLGSYLMYPKVYQAYAKHRSQYGDVSGIPTSTYFYGLQDHEEIAVSIEQGKTLHIRVEGRTPADDKGHCRLFFELNGQPRLVRIPLLGAKVNTKSHRQAEDGNLNHVPSPMPGSVARIAVKEGQKIAKGDVLASIEAMKMESLITSERDGTVSHIYVKSGESVVSKTLLMEIV